MLSKTDSLILKGIGILLIVFHNFFHKIGSILGENEFRFNTEIINNYNTAFSEQPLHILKHLFSYFGHYGVQIFIFCSGYGLALSYGRNNISFNNFIKKRLLKLYPVFILVILIIIIYRYVLMQVPFTIEALWDVFLRITLIANWIPGKQLILSGPFWFYSLIVQLYIVFFIFMRLFKNKIKIQWLIFLLSYVLIFSLYHYFDGLKLSIYFNFIGNLPVFILGILLANIKYNIAKTPYWAIGLALVLFVFGQFNLYLWMVSQLTFVVIFIPLILKLKSNISVVKLKSFLLYTGKLSMYMFAVNGILRAPWTYIYRQFDNEWLIYLLVIGYLISVYLVAEILKKIETYFLSKYFKRI